MEKIRCQILLDAVSHSRLTQFCMENRLKNMSEGVRELLKTYQRLQTVIINLENAAHQNTKLKAEGEN